MSQQLGSVVISQGATHLDCHIPGLGAAEDGVKVRHFNPVLSPLITINSTNLSKQAGDVCTETSSRDQSFDISVPAVSAVGEMRPR